MRGTQIQADFLSPIDPNTSISLPPPPQILTFFLQSTVAYHGKPRACRRLISSCSGCVLSTPRLAQSIPMTCVTRALLLESQTDKVSQILPLKTSPTQLPLRSVRQLQHVLLSFCAGRDFENFCPPHNSAVNINESEFLHMFPQNRKLTSTTRFHSRLCVFACACAFCICVSSSVSAPHWLVL